MVDPALQVWLKEARLVLKVDGDQRENFLWEYTLVIQNTRKSPVLLLGRRWEIDVGHGFKPVPAEGFAPSLGGEHPLLGPNEDYEFNAGVVTTTPNPRGMKGEFAALDYRSGPFRVEVHQFNFPASSEDVPHYPALGKLGPGDVAQLRKYVDSYNEAVQVGPALFRVEDIPLSEGGEALVNSFLLDEEERDKSKSRKFDFSPIIPDRNNVKLVIEQCDDHYFLPRNKKKIFESKKSFFFSFVISSKIPFMPPRGPSRGAALQVEVTRLLEDYGFRDVIIEIAGHAPTSDRALERGTDLADRATRPDPITAALEAAGVPSMSRDMVRLEVLVPILRNTRIKWVDRKNHVETASLGNVFKFFRQVLPELIGEDGTVYKELVRSVDNRLAAQMDMYVSGREGRNAGPGDAAGLKFILKQVSPNKRRAKVGAETIIGKC